MIGISKPPLGSNPITVDRQNLPNGEVVVYEAPSSEARVDVRLEGETVWLTQRQMGEVFGTTPENVLMHLGNIFASDELAEQATTKDFLVVQTEGKRQVRRTLEHFKLDAVNLLADPLK